MKRPQFSIEPVEPTKEDKAAAKKLQMILENHFANSPEPVITQQMINDYYNKHPEEFGLVSVKWDKRDD